jgi:hypothetical protein
VKRFAVGAALVFMFFPSFAASVFSAAFRAHWSVANLQIGALLLLQ